MELEFDKEIHALLRQSAQDEGAFAENVSRSAFSAPHLGADEISAFAENALPEKMRGAYAAHLADCDRCRKILSNVISLNSTAEAETIHAPETRESAVVPVVWYRRIFAFPNLAYSLGALILVFAGIAALTVLQSVKRTETAEISKTTERPMGGKGMSSDGDSAPAASGESSSSNTMTANSSAMSSSVNRSTSAANSMTIPAPGAMANSNSAVARDEEAEKNLQKPVTKTAEQPNAPTDLSKAETSAASGAPPPAKENNYQLDGNEQEKQQPQNSIASAQTDAITDSRRAETVPSAVLRAEPKSKKTQSAKDEAQDKISAGTAAATTVGGKTFRRNGNVWYDTAYRGQATTNVTRGTNEYKKLDSGLRVIVENLGGTVVIVWKEKAYRIQ